MKNRPKYLGITKNDVTIECHYRHTDHGWAQSPRVDLIFSKVLKNVSQKRADYILTQLYGQSLKDEIWKANMDDDEV